MEKLNIFKNKNEPNREIGIVTNGIIVALIFLKKKNNDEYKHNSLKYRRSNIFQGLPDEISLVRNYIHFYFCG
ncbi:hypothetical protein MHYMCMPSP_00756 [Hyalomma marginatum]|uniref:Uncharacterized protein n=1 Tax=Hyalomma marginatum TaxID=34627 RepID=A0A8S4BWP8_9ACAR|nr:hypothetical protein MHYMCMPASI_00531 [Hyalomma marginatum]CAG7592919.1 hypothetical protein MHYMCMPSP_00756 [Hyalomma marginatum]